MSPGLSGQISQSGSAVGFKPDCAIDYVSSGMDTRLLRGQASTIDQCLDKGVVCSYLIENAISQYVDSAVSDMSVNQFGWRDEASYKSCPHPAA